MAELNIFPTGLTYSRNTKAPLEANRVFTTLALAQAYVDNVDQTAYVGMTISVVDDGINNGLYYVEKVADESNVTGLLSRVGSDVAADLAAVKGDITNINSTLVNKADRFVVGSGISYVDNKLDLKIDPSDDNALSVSDNGIIVKIKDVNIPEYSLDPVADPASGYAAQYEFKKDGVVINTINITEDQFLKSATFHATPEDGVTTEAPYLKFVWNVQDGQSISYVPVGELVDTYTAGDAIEIKNNKISVKLGSESHGLVIKDSSLTLNLASSTNDGAMSKEDKKTIDSIGKVYEKRRYAIVESPDGTLVNYLDKEMRIMCPSGTEFTKQNVGTGGNANMHYITFRAYAPDNAIGFKEDLSKTINDQTMYDFNGNGGGVDAYGRKYSRIWLAVASYDSVTDTWSYFGDKSNEDKYIGWDYTVEWYDANGIVIESDTIRINLSNESCHLTGRPYYMSNTMSAVTAGNGILIDSTNKNNPKISVNIKSGSALVSTEDGLDIAWTELN